MYHATEVATITSLTRDCKPHPHTQACVKGPKIGFLISFLSFADLLPC